MCLFLAAEMLVANNSSSIGRRRTMGFPLLFILSSVVFLGEASMPKAKTQGAEQREAAAAGSR